ncbi:MAG: hypothetical protein RLY20_2475 [Verrucomicrobiota bacterium]|jgi:hypothetical protein
MRKKLLLAAAILVLTLLGLLIIATPRGESESPLPNPNGYDDFLKAAALLNANPPDWQGLKDQEQHEALLRLVATNRAALDTLRAGLTKQCRVPAWVVNGTNFPHINDLARLKALAQSLAAASKLSLIEGRTNEAAAFAVDCIRFGNESYRGGVLIDGLVGIAIKSIGLSSLNSAADGMDLESTRKALSALEEVASRSESSDEIAKRERHWAHRGRFGPAGFLTGLLQPFINRAALQKGRQKFAKIETDLARMRLRLAGRAFELENGKPPVSSKDLVPQYLKSVPLDPETGKELPLD